MQIRIDRRSFVFSTGACLLLSGIGLPVYALTDAQARVLVDKVVKDINAVISSGQPLSGMIRDFEKIFVHYGDVNIIARTALGPDARRFSNDQMSAYITAFRGYISRKYGKRFNEFVGGKIEVQGVRQVKSYHEVQSTVFLKGEAPFGVNFLVSDKSGKDLFFDMVIEGISLRLTERTEIGAMLDWRKGDINGMIADLDKAG